MDEFPRKLWSYVAAMIAVSACFAVFFAVNEPAPDIVAVFVLGGLMTYCAHRAIVLPNGTFVTPGFMVCMAAIVVFVDAGTMAGVLAIGFASGLNFTHLKANTWGWIPFNGGMTALAFLAAAGVFAAFPDSMTNAVPQAFVPVAAASAVYVAVAVLLLAGSYLVERGSVPREVVSDVALLFLQTFPFALLGYLLGQLCIELGLGVMVLIVVPIIIAREMFSSYVAVKASHDETVQMLIRALEKKDQYTAGHSERVAVYAQYMGEEFTFGPARMERLRFAALMHDIGKLVVPNHILNKPGKLTEEEFARVRLHEKVSVQMLSHIDFLKPIAAATHSDAMRFDPDDHDHPVEPYIIMVADAYDAMTSTRSYRKALTQDVAFEELRAKAGTQFHPACVDAFIKALERRGEVHGDGYEVQTEFENAPVVGLGSAGLGDLLVSES